MYMPNDLRGDLVLARTQNGQKVAVEDSSTLETDDRRLLLLVNGFTPLSHLEERLPIGNELKAAVRKLLDRGLVSQVQAAEPAAWSPASVRPH
ncbi:hypothetical protein LRH25_29190 [Ideonella azotifigens]|uniref:Uncharacterized protein n=1 Tax=Ideonella azotifigens TaxID=513160 RepID=A0ABN1K5U7_9BURK|nr:hypothetical protein [Ideonella azotifigens]MCD2344405.1 hypothetical protein [Ideonella azotifigens]